MELILSEDTFESAAEETWRVVKMNSARLPAGTNALAQIKEEEYQCSRSTYSCTLVQYGSPRALGRSAGKVRGLRPPYAADPRPFLSAKASGTVASVSIATTMTAPEMPMRSPTKPLSGGDTAAEPMASV
jgi:hypothetical protein